MEPTTNNPGTITSLVNGLAAGEPLAGDERCLRVYAELRGMAHLRLRGNSRKESIAPTDLVHKVYLKLFVAADGAESKAAGGPRWDNRAHFYGSAARAMEQLLINDARKAEVRRKRLGDRAKDGPDGGPLEPDALPAQIDNAKATPDVLVVSQALKELEVIDPPLAELVRLRIYLGQTVATIAESRGVSARTVHRSWAMARAWLFKRMREMGAP